jgi:hypothetical protein
MKQVIRCVVGGSIVLGVYMLAGNSSVPPRIVGLTTHASVQSTTLTTGRDIFRHDTFGDEQFWTDKLQMHDVVEKVTPADALGLGLRVDSDALPTGFLASHSLNSSSTTVALLGLDAIVGLKATVNGNNVMRLGITCALCHSTVDNSVASGVGKRLDGWPNTRLDPGKIIALSPVLSEVTKAVYRSWGPGMYDPRFNIDGLNDPVVIPPAFGLADVDKEIYTGDGPISYWNNYVAVTQMGGQGTFIDRRLQIEIVQTPDLVTSKLPALQDYQLSLSTPPPPPGSFDPQAAKRGEVFFNGVAKCSTCHIPPTYTDVNLGILHAPAETGMDPLYASRSATKMYRTTPLRALWQHPPYFHDGSAATLDEVVEHYVEVLGLHLSRNQQRDLVDFLKTL